ncbi:MAG: ABC transporter permease [Paludibacteraceae bacterium]
MEDTIKHKTSKSTRSNPFVLSRLAEVFHEIFATLKHNKLRTALTGLSVSWGIFILIILLGAGNGLQNGVTSNFGRRAINTIQMWPGTTSKPFKGLKTKRDLKFTEKELKSVDEYIPEKDDETGIINRSSTITYKNEYGDYSVVGVHPAYKKVFDLEFLPGNGRFINDLDVKNRDKIIVIDKKIAETLFKNGKSLGEYVKVGSIMFKVVGINTKKEGWGGSQAFIPFSTAQSIYNPDKKFRSIAFTTKAKTLETTAENEKFNERLTKNMSRTMLFDPEDSEALWISNSQENYLQTMKIFNGLNLFVTIVGIFTLIAGIVGVSNIMLVSVKERTREIGIKKAIGAPPASILRSIVIESIVITALFGYIGMVLGVGLTEVVNYIMEQGAAVAGSGDSPADNMSIFKNPTVQLSYVVFSTIVLIISGIIAGYMPARRATRIKPIEAMREE